MKPARKISRFRVVPLNSNEGRKRFKKAWGAPNFLVLAQNFQPQVNPYYCGVACSVILLNCLRSKTSAVYHQANFLSAKTDHIKPRRFLTAGAKGKRDAGLTLEQVAQLLRGRSAKVKIYPAVDGAEEAFRRRVKKTLGRPGHFMLVNFLYTGLFAQGGGHFCPLGAYDQASDSVLLLEVANYRSLWYWAPIPRLYQAMAAVDPEAEQARGYLLVSQ